MSLNSSSIHNRWASIELEFSFKLDLLYTYVQVVCVCSQKVRALQPAKPIDSTQFRRLLDADTALKLVTLAPLFTALNDAPNSR